MGNCEMAHLPYVYCYRVVGEKDRRGADCLESAIAFVRSDVRGYLEHQAIIEKGRMPVGEVKVILDPPDYDEPVPAGHRALELRLAHTH